MPKRKRKFTKKRTKPLLRKLYEVQTYEPDEGGFITYSISRDKKSAEYFKNKLEEDGFDTRLIERKH